MIAYHDTVEAEKHSKVNQRAPICLLRQIISCSLVQSTAEAAEALNFVVGVADVFHPLHLAPVDGEWCLVLEHSRDQEVKSWAEMIRQSAATRMKDLGEAAVLAAAGIAECAALSLAHACDVGLEPETAMVHSAMYMKDERKKVEAEQTRRSRGRTEPRRADLPGVDLPVDLGQCSSASTLR